MYLNTDIIQSPTIPNADEVYRKRLPGYLIGVGVRLPRKVSVKPSKTIEATFPFITPDGARAIRWF